LCGLANEGSLLSGKFTWHLRRHWWLSGRHRHLLVPRSNVRKAGVSGTAPPGAAAAAMDLRSRVNGGKVSDRCCPKEAIPVSPSKLTSVRPLISPGPALTPKATKGLT
jgi:hypothetical protein